MHLYMYISMYVYVSVYVYIYVCIHCIPMTSKIVGDRPPSRPEKRGTRPGISAAATEMLNGTPPSTNGDLIINQDLMEINRNLIGI